MGESAGCRQKAGAWNHGARGYSRIDRPAAYSRTGWSPLSVPTGIKAVQSYRTLPNGAAASREESVRSAVTAAGVSHAMVTRIGNVSTQVNVSPGMVMGPAWGPGWGPGWGPPFLGGGGFGWGGGWGGLNGYYGSMWGPAIPPQITTTQNVHADTETVQH